jgi:hypothetical protein
VSAKYRNSDGDERLVARRMKRKTGEGGDVWSWYMGGSILPVELVSLG